MRKRNSLTIIFIFLVCMVIAATVTFMGRKEIKISENKGKDTVGNQETVSDVDMDSSADMDSREDIDYSGMGNQQGNTENGGSQTYVTNRGIVIGLFGESMWCFDDSTQELSFFCNKSSCLHVGKDCISNQPMSYLLSYSSVVFGVPDSTRNEIWKCQNNEIECLYRAEDDIYGIWGYQGYLYYMTDFGVFRILIENPSEAEPVLELLVDIEYLTFYEDKMYFCEENRFIYKANLDGSKKKRVCNEKGAAPQICNGILYYRSKEYDENGQFQVKNSLKSISLKDGKEKTVLDTVYQFNVDTEENKIYYTELPSAEGESSLNVLDLGSGEMKRITNCASGYLYTFPQSDWMVLKKTDGELPEGEEGGKPTHFYCIKKDGTGEKRLDYPERIEE